MTAKRGETRNLLLQPVWAGISGTEAQGGLGMQARIEVTQHPAQEKAQGRPTVYPHATRVRTGEARLESGEPDRVAAQAMSTPATLGTSTETSRSPVSGLKRLTLTGGFRSSSPHGVHRADQLRPAHHSAGRLSKPPNPGARTRSRPEVRLGPIRPSTCRLLRGFEGKKSERGVGKGLPVPPTPPRRATAQQPRHRPGRRRGMSQVNTSRRR